MGESFIQSGGSVSIGDCNSSKDGGAGSLSVRAGDAPQEACISRTGSTSLAAM